MKVGSGFNFERLPQEGPCLLCGGGDRRVRSHLIPQFATRGLRETSATGYIRTSEAVDRPAQAGPWDHMLCTGCEGRFNQWETPFANRVFRPFLEDVRGMLQYGPWLPLFATSLTWRVLTFYREHPEVRRHHKVIEDWSRTDDAERTWRECLLGERPHPGRHQQHYVRFDFVANATGPVPSNLNSYLMRSMDFDVMATNRDVIVYMKLPGFMFFGFAGVHSTKGWRGTRLGFNGGTMDHRNVQIPEYIAKDFINPKADLVRTAAASMSERQKAKVAERVRSDPDRAARSGTLRAIAHDRSLSDPEAVGAEESDGLGDAATPIPSDRGTKGESR